MAKRKTHIYACGGGAIDITAAQATITDSLGFSDAVISRIDTSFSNITENMPSDSVYVLEGADGSGSERRHNYKPIMKAMNQILARFQPGDYNIVLFTTSGGSGSVLGPLIVSELLSRKLPVVALIVNTCGSKTEIDNSIDTTKSLSGIVNNVKLPLVFSEVTVNASKSFDAAAREVRGTLSMLLSLFDSKNVGLDSRDITNFLQYTNIRGGNPSLVHLDVFTDETIGQIAGEYPQSMASLYKDENRGVTGVTPVHYTAGSRDKDITDERMRVTTHYVIREEPVSAMYKSLSQLQEQIVLADRAKAPTISLLEDDDNADSNGMVI